MKFDIEQEGLLTLFKPYQTALLERLWEINKSARVGMNSGEAHRFLLEGPNKKSRASVIFFLNDMVEEGVLEYEERSGKGGYHRVYYPKMDRKQFAQYVVETITDKLGEVFPEV
ncbi:MAG: hypothetical protein JSV27_11665 [Candidatus Bathyarchaeota archaeon]|nr:MAG: hypothetical protein JSV27_11665 [Candidatus Bathyarchaeota archaeon]